MAGNHINSATAYAGEFLDSANGNKLLLSSSGSFKARKKPAPPLISRAASDVDDIVTLLHGSDPVRVELNRLENEARGPLPLPISSAFVSHNACATADSWLF